MSLVGSELVFDKHQSDEPEQYHTPQSPTLSSVTAAMAINHPPVSPARPAEALFLSGLSSQNISAAALAQQIHRSHRPMSMTSSIQTDDFYTAADELSLSLPFTPTSDLYSDEPFGKDTQVYSSETIYEDDQEHNQDSMSSPIQIEANTNVDAAEKLYGTAKGVWTWGKGIFFVNPFLGMAEAVAGKAVSMAGLSLQTVDTIVV
jgi:hypothetical protein